MFTDDQAREVLRRWSAGESLYAIANDLGVSRAMLTLLVRGRRYQHIDRSPYTRKPEPARTSRDPFVFTRLPDGSIQKQRRA